MHAGSLDKGADAPASEKTAMPEICTAEPELLVNGPP